MYPVTRSHGAWLQDDGSTRFALWAPDARQVELRLASGETRPMAPHADGWYSVQLPVGAGTAYRFRIDGELEVPDPASRRQLDDVHGDSEVQDPSRYAWRCTEWNGRPWHEAVIYELHVGLLGGYRGVEMVLPHLASLGITAVELMPIAEFPGDRNWGYDGVLPYAPSASYGTPDDLKSLIDTAHGLGLMVFLDVVYNHFGPEGNYLGAYASRFFDEATHTPWGLSLIHI